MKNKIIKKIIAITLTVCMIISVFSVSMGTAYAEVSLKTLDGWATNQLYTRCLSMAGSVLTTIGEASGHEGFAEFTSFINNTFCGGSSTGEQLAQLQNTCNEILETTKKVESVANDINSKIANNTITTSSANCDKAWESQIMDYITKNDESPYDFYNVYIAYRNYLNYACNPSSIPDGKTIEYYENNFINQIINYYKGKTNTNFASEKEIYTTDTIDVCLTGLICSILNTMDPETTSVGMGNRFIDQAAQYAYYAYPYSSEQAEFVDYATQYQVNTVTYLVMIYQDFLAHRADYFENNKSEENTQSNEYIWNYCNDNHYTPLLDKFTTAIESFLNGDIYLKETGAHTTLDKYVREDSVTVYCDKEKDSFILTNNNFKTEHNNRYIKCTNEYYYNSNITSYPVFTSKNMSFLKNASVTVKDKKLVFTPFYVLNSDSLENCNKLLKTFDLNDEDVHGEIKLTSFYDTHYMNVDYYNLKDGSFSDGTNTYTPVSDVNQLKSLINETYYTANKCTPYSYFSSFIGYGANDPVYLLLKGNPTLSRPENTTHYTKFPVFNMSSSIEYSTAWNSEMMSLYNLQNDRKGSDNKTNSKYTLILVPQNNETKSKVDTKLTGAGEVTVSGLSSGTAVSGEKIEVNITVPENHWISSITAQYHNDPSNPSKITDEKVISTGIGSNEFTLSYPVPYSNVTLAVETKESPKELDVDKNGNFVVSSYDDLCQVATMVNSGYSKYTKGNYVLTRDISIPSETQWSNPIGTEENPFCGTFDGQKHTISNLWLDGHSKTQNMGLFGVVTDGTVKNLNIIMATYSILEKHDTVGSVCGYLKNGTISNCIVIGDFCSYGNYVGGIAGACENSKITNCASELYMIADSTLSDGICPKVINSEISDCISNSVIMKA